jgi:hypothetical protein
MWPLVRYYRREGKGYVDAIQFTRKNLIDVKLLTQIDVKYILGNYFIKDVDLEDDWKVIYLGEYIQINSFGDFQIRNKFLFELRYITIKRFMKETS